MNQESNISPMTCWVNATQHFSCYPALVHTVRVSISISCPLLLSCSLFLHDLRQACSSPSSPHPRIKCHGSTSCSSQGLKQTTSNTVTLTNVFYRSTINNMKVKSVEGNAIHIKPSGGARRHFEHDIQHAWKPKQQHPYIAHFSVKQAINFLSQ